MASPAPPAAFSRLPAPLPPGPRVALRDALARHDPGVRTPHIIGCIVNTTRRLDVAPGVTFQAVALFDAALRAWPHRLRCSDAVPVAVAAIDVAVRTSGGRASRLTRRQVAAMTLSTEAVGAHASTMDDLLEAVGFRTYTPSAWDELALLCASLRAAGRPRELLVRAVSDSVLCLEVAIADPELADAPPRELASAVLEIATSRGFWPEDPLPLKDFAARAWERIAALRARMPHTKKRDRAQWQRLDEAMQKTTA